MGGLFGVVSKQDCVADLFYGTDYHSHLGTKRGGLAVKSHERITRFIHNIENAQFRSKFEDDISKLKGNKGIGIISDTEDQPVLIRSHLGNYSIATVGVIQNADALASKAFETNATHFAELSFGGINPTELVATLINEEMSFVEGIQNAQDAIDGSCSMLLLTEEGVYAARDKYGRTPIVIGEKSSGFAATSETCAFPNLDYEVTKYLGPGEIVLISEEGIESKKPPGDLLQICAFLWVYYGFPASYYEGINVESVRNKCGAFLAHREDHSIDLVAGIPDSGVGHGLGFASEAGIPFKRPSRYQRLGGTDETHPDQRPDRE
jgi:amidophosphoribosyltransferase